MIQSDDTVDNIIILQGYTKYTNWPRDMRAVVGIKLSLVQK